MEPIRVLERHPLFRSLSRARREALAGACRLISCPAGQVLCRQGSRGRRMFVLLEGEAEVYKIARKGVRLNLAVLGPGEIFGELSLIDGGPREAHVVARVPTVCLAVPRREFREALRVDAGLAQALLKVLVKRLRHTDRRVLL